MDFSTLTRCGQEGFQWAQDFRTVSGKAQGGRNSFLPFAKSKSRKHTCEGRYLDGLVGRCGMRVQESVRLDVGQLGDGLEESERRRLMRGTPDGREEASSLAAYAPSATSWISLWGSHS